MKIALYIEDGREQVVLTPQNETEANILRRLHEDKSITKIYRGQFYACQGGWTRWDDTLLMGSTSPIDQSLIFVIEHPKQEAHL